VGSVDVNRIRLISYCPQFLLHEWKLEKPLKIMAKEDQQDLDAGLL